MRANPRDHTHTNFVVRRVYHIWMRTTATYPPSTFDSARYRRRLYSVVGGRRGGGGVDLSREGPCYGAAGGGFQHGQTIRVMEFSAALCGGWGDGGGAAPTMGPMVDAIEGE